MKINIVLVWAYGCGLGLRKGGGYSYQKAKGRTLVLKELFCTLTVVLDTQIYMW